MPLQALLTQVDPGWYSRTGEPLDPRLLAAARRSRLGLRLLARTLLRDGGAEELLAPRPGATTPTAILRWPRAKLGRLVRDLGVLSYAPLIRAEVRREPVRRLKQALAGSYLLALDPTIWDARVDRDVQYRLQQAWEPLWSATLSRFGSRARARSRSCSRASHPSSRSRIEHEEDRDHRGHGV